MPARLLRDGILDSEAVCSLTFQAEVFYRRLMSVVDDFGRYDGRPNLLRSRLYPLQIDKVREADIPRWIAECETAGLIALYSAAGKPYILFHKLGTPRAEKSKFPAPPDGTQRLPTSENACAQMKADESNRLQVLSDVPYSYSITDSITDSIKDPPTPPQPGGEPAKESRKKKPPNPEEHPSFAGFWSAYPRKINRSGASKAFSKIDPDDTLAAAMLAAIDRQKNSAQWTKDGGEFIPHPATWLNGRRWEDELPVASLVPKPSPAAGFQTRGQRESAHILNTIAAALNEE